MNGEIKYSNGYNETYVYGNNFSGYHWDYTNPLEGRPQDPAEGFLFHTARYNNYDFFKDPLSHRLGLYLAIASAVGFAGVLFSLANTKWGKQ